MMKKEQEATEITSDNIVSSLREMDGYFQYDYDTTSPSGLTNTFILQPKLDLIAYWNPQEDITIYELAKSMPYVANGGDSGYLLSSETINLEESFWRHFNISTNNGLY